MNLRKQPPPAESSRHQAAVHLRTRIQFPAVMFPRRLPSSHQYANARPAYSAPATIPEPFSFGLPQRSILRSCYGIDVLENLIPVTAQDAVADDPLLTAKIQGICIDSGYVITRWSDVRIAVAAVSYEALRTPRVPDVGFFYSSPCFLYSGCPESMIEMSSRVPDVWMSTGRLHCRTGTVRIGRACLSALHSAREIRSWCVHPDVVTF